MRYRTARERLEMSLGSLNRFAHLLSPHLILCVKTPLVNRFTCALQPICATNSGRVRETMLFQCVRGPGEAPNGTILTGWATSHLAVSTS
jgi:hypothetical protein